MINVRLHVALLWRLSEFTSEGQLKPKQQFLTHQRYSSTNVIRSLVTMRLLEEFDRRWSGAQATGGSINGQRSSMFHLRTCEGCARQLSDLGVTFVNTTDHDLCSTCSVIVEPIHHRYNSFQL